MVSWEYANAILGAEHDLVSSTIKIRQAGFADCIDSEVSVLQLLDEVRAEGLLPARRTCRSARPHLSGP